MFVIISVLNLLWENPFEMAQPSDIVQSTIDFITRGREQLIAKRQDVKCLRDIEALFNDEVKFYYLMKKALDKLPASAKTSFPELFSDFDAIDKDLDIVCQYRQQYVDIRETKRNTIAQVETRYPPRPSYRITSISKYADDFIVHQNQKLPEFNYRTCQFSVYFKQLVEQYCKLDGPNPKTTATVHCSGESFKFKSCGFFSYPYALLTGQQIIPRLPSRDYFFVDSNPIDTECARYMQMFITECVVLGEIKFESNEYLPYIDPISCGVPPLPSSDSDSD